MTIVCSDVGLLSLGPVWYGTDSDTDTDETSLNCHSKRTHAGTAVQALRCLAGTLPPGWNDLTRAERYVTKS